MPEPHFLSALVGAEAQHFSLTIAGRPRPLAGSVETAFDRETRNRGLLGRASLDPDTALIIAPCSAVHTFKMQFAIDLIYVARDGRVLKTRAAVPPGRMSMCAGAFAVIEMAAGAVERSGLRVGDHVSASAVADRRSRR